MKKRNVQNKAKDYQSGKYFLAMYKHHMYKYYQSYKDIANNFLIVNLSEIF